MIAFKEESAKRDALSTKSAPPVTSLATPPARPLPLTPPELDKQADQKKPQQSKQATVGRAAGKQVMSTYGPSLKGADGLTPPKPTPPPRPSTQPPNNKGKGENTR